MKERKRKKMEPQMEARLLKMQVEFFAEKKRTKRFNLVLFKLLCNFKNVCVFETFFSLSFYIDIKLSYKKLNICWKISNK